MTSISERIANSRMVNDGSPAEAASSRDHSIIRVFVNACAQLGTMGTAEMRMRMALEIASHEAGEVLDIEKVKAYALAHKTRFAGLHADLTNEREALLTSTVSANLEASLVTLRAQRLAMESEISELQEKIDNLQIAFDESYSEVEALEESLSLERNANARAQQTKLTHVNRNLQRVNSVLRELNTCQTIFDNYQIQMEKR